MTQDIPLSTIREHLRHAFDLLKRDLWARHSHVVYASGLASMAGSPPSDATYSGMLQAIASRTTEVERAHEFLDRTLFAMLGEPAALVHIRPYFEQGLAKGGGQ